MKPHKATLKETFQLPETAGGFHWEETEDNAGVKHVYYT